AETISDLVKKTALVVEEANQKLLDKESHLKQEQRALEHTLQKEKASLLNELEILRHDLTSKEAQFHKSLTDTEAQLHHRMEQELGEHVNQLKEQHAAVTGALSRDMTVQLEAALQ